MDIDDPSAPWNPCVTGAMFAVYFQGSFQSLIQNDMPTVYRPPHDSPPCLSDRWIRQEFISPQGYCYGYNVNEPAAVDYLLNKHPEWSNTYHPFTNHWGPMTVVARDLSDACGLTVYADSIWVGGGCIGLGMVFTGINMGDNVRTPEDDKKLKKLERKLLKHKLVTTPKLEVLCSCTYRPHLEEPFHMNILPAPKGPGVQEIFRIIKYWREEHERRRKASTRREGRRKNGVSP